MMDMTFCKDTECPYKGTCKRYSDSAETMWRFTESPRNGDKCEMYWGENQQNIMDKLESIVKGEEK